MNTNEETKKPLFQHPMAEELNKLEQQKRIAKQNNDQVAYEYAKSNIERIIRENPADVSQEKWDSMGLEEKKSFYKLKMQEAKVLNDQDDYDYYNSNLRMLEERNKNKEPEVKKEELVEFSSVIDKLREDGRQITADFKSWRESGQLDNDKIATLIGRLDYLANNVSTLSAFATTEESKKKIEAIVATINNEKARISNTPINIAETGGSSRK